MVVMRLRPRDTDSVDGWNGDVNLAFIPPSVSTSRPARQVKMNGTKDVFLVIFCTMTSALAIYMQQE